MLMALIEKSLSSWKTSNLIVVALFLLQSVFVVNPFAFPPISTTATCFPRQQSRAILITRISSGPKNDDPATNKQDSLGGVLDFIFNPYESKIPKEIEKDIYQAEAQTPAAQERGQRVLFYALLAFAGILCAFFNGFLTELRSDTNFDLEQAGFGWVQSNSVTSFFFTNKIGGLIGLLGGAGSGLLAEAEYDTRRINAEQIFEEMQRRRAIKEQSNLKKNSNKPLKVGKKKGLSGKEKKRISALSEVVLEDKQNTTSTGIAEQVNEVERSSSADDIRDTEGRQDMEERGIFGKLKEFYQRADSVAATQALLLNKKLEDEGIIEKITDETGLKVIGKEEAAKLQKQKESKK